jgi:tetratricopeptide (TPR) repeat protein
MKQHTLNRLFLAGGLLLLPLQAEAAKKKAERPNYVACYGFDLLREYGESGPLAPEVKPGEAGLAACDAILQIPPKRLDYWYNASNFQQKRALNLLSLHRDAEAILALDEADKVGNSKSDVLYDGSLAISSAVLRAIALRKIGQPKDALSTIEKVRSARPYNMEVQSLLDDVELAISGNLNLYVDRLIQRASFDPNRMRSSLPFFIATARYKDALPFIESISFKNPAVIKGWTQKLRPVALEEALFKKQAAYIYKSLGDSKTAEQFRLEAANAGLAQAACTIPAKGQAGLESARQCRVAAASISEQIDYWENAIEMLDRVNNTSASKEEIESLLRFMNKDKFNPIFIDLKNKIYQKYKIGVQNKSYFKFDDFNRNFEAVTSYKGIAMRLSSGDSVDRVPEFENGKQTNWLVDEINGLTETVDNSSQQRDMHFTSDWANESILDDMLLFGVIQKAKALKKDSVVFISRNNIKRLTKYDNGNTYVSGTEVSCIILFFNYGDSNSEIKNSKWRSIKISDLESQISPRHLKIMTEKANYKRPFF